MYSEKFGGSRIKDVEVLSVSAGREVTRLLDLQRPQDAPSERYDCVLCTQTLQFIFDVESAVKSLSRMLKPEGSLLVTVPGIAQISPHDVATTGEYWRFTHNSVSRLFENHFADGSVSIVTYGNVMSAVALLHGISADELSSQQLSDLDPNYPVIIGAVVTK
jgi:SAM-dependent methyltransferase